MNTVHIELNSYTREVRFFVNDIQTDPYSALSNFTYDQALRDPGEILEAVGRELNDDFDLEVTATDWEYGKLEAAALDSEDCNCCTCRRPAIALSGRERAEMLGDRLPEQTFVVLTSERDLPQPRSYGNLTLCFTPDPSRATNRELAGEKAVAGAAETLLINPAIGAAARKAAAGDSRFAVCHSLSPVVCVSFPRTIQAGDSVEALVSVFPQGHPIPAVTIRSANPEVVSAEGIVLTARNAGMTSLQAFLSGEAVPFHTRKIRVEKQIWATHITVENLDGILPEGRTVALSLGVFPPDASDADRLSCQTSDPDIAEFVGGCLKLKAPGQCEIVIAGRKAICTKTIRVSAGLRAFGLSAENLELNLGQKYPITVRCIPADAYNTGYSWRTSDATVAVVVEEEGQEYIKAIGMGSCSIVCRSDDGDVKAVCTTTVKSAMYKRKTLADYKKTARALAGTVRGMAASTAKTSETDSHRAQEAYPRGTKTLDAFADLEVRFTGTDGEGTVLLTNHSRHPFLRSCIYTACPSRGVSNGQEIVLLVGCHRAGRICPGFAVARCCRTVTVSGLGRRMED